jgi:hypothetical protein
MYKKFQRVLSFLFLCSFRNVIFILIIEENVIKSWFTFKQSSSKLHRQVPLMEQELLNLPEHLSSPTVFSEVRVAQSLVFCVVLCRSFLSFCPLSFCYCVFCPSIYRFWLPLWYLQTLLTSFIDKTDIPSSQEKLFINHGPVPMIGEVRNVRL